jgi:glycosyltransferase involved in cell wall biosynthesis
MKILLFSNTDWFMFNFNSRLIRALIIAGHEVSVTVPNGPYISSLAELGCKVIVAPLTRKSVNPVKEFLFLSWLFGVLRRERPDLIHNFTLKCVLWGSLAALAAKVPVRVNELTGLGFVFTSNGLKAQAIRTIVYLLFRVVLKGNNSHLLTLNVNDYNLFTNHKWLSPCKIHLVFGAGVDCNRFHPAKIAYCAGFRVLLPARMLWDKGVGEFVEAAKDLMQLGIEAEFLLAGNADVGNPTSIPEVTLREWDSSRIVKWLGHVDDMAALYSTVHVVVLPSYREGLPSSLTEAAAFGLPLIATDVPGCLDVVNDGVNGFLVPVRDSNALASAIHKLYLNRDLCERFGLISRKFAESKFNEQVIINQRLAIYSESN